MQTIWKTYWKIKDISPFSREQMHTENSDTRMEDQREDHSDPKRPPQKSTPNNYRPIRCLPIMWKTLTAQIWEKTYCSLISRGIFPKEQKICRKKTRGAGDLLCIDQHVFNVSKARRKILAMVWIEYKKAYDMVHQSWIRHCLKIYKILDQVIQLIETMETWRVELTAEVKRLAYEVIILKKNYPRVFWDIIKRNIKKN